MLSLYNHGGTIRIGFVHDTVSDLGGKVFLYLESSCKHIDDSGNFG
jgi:hypothetical protein